MATMKEQDLAWNQRLAIKLLAESKARATGNWGKHLKCIPGDAKSWKESVKQPFVRIGRAANYQKYKCGDWEGSVHEDQQKGRSPVADGLSPTKGNPSSTGCLILEAKSSRHKTKDRHKSLYSLQTKKKRLSGKDRRKIAERYRSILKRSPWVGAVDGAGYLGSKLGPVVSTVNIEGGDTSMLEDLIPSARDHSSSGIWALVRSMTMMQIGLYEAACVHEDVPYVKFIVIYEQPYMKRYFQSIKTPNMKLKQSAFKRAPTWKNG